MLLLNATESKESSIWWIPISYTTAKELDFDSTKPKLWMRGEKSLLVKNAAIGVNDWLIANIQQTGRQLYFLSPL